jgi:outer membrane receptor protein involved in Fe transport
MLGDPNKLASNHRANIDYGNDKFRVFISDRLNYQGYRAFSNKETEIVSEGDVVNFRLNGDGDAVTIRNNTNYGIDLFLNDKNTLNLYGNTNAFLAKQSDFDEVGTQYVNGLMTDQYDMTTNLRNEGLGFYNSLFYKHNFEQKGHELTSQIDYYTFSGNAHNTFDYMYTFLDGTLDEPIEINRFEDTRNHRQMVQSRNEYSKVFAKIRWKFGYWAYYQWLDNDFGGMTDNTQFEFNELRHEAFANGGGAFGKFNYNLGLRYAYSTSRIDQSATNTYNAFLPQISLMYGIRKGHSLKFSARRRIVRPTMNQLNPFEVRMDSSSIQMGNPNLDPQIINRVEFQYGINFKKNYLGPKLFFEYTTNGMESLMSIDNEGKTVTKPENIGERFEYGFSVNGALTLLRWMKINANARVYNTTVSGPNYKDDLWTVGANGNLVFTPWRERKINFSAMIQYSTARLGYKSINTRDILFLLTSDITIKDNLRITGMFNPIGELFKYAGTERTDTNYYFLQEGHIDLNYVIMIGVAYNFKWGKTPKKINRSTDYESDGGGGVL